LNEEWNLYRKGITVIISAAFNCGQLLQLKVSQEIRVAHISFFISLLGFTGAWGGVVVKALRY
jgi:hypothetical protein